MASVLDSLKVFTATREDAWLYRGQMSLVVDGYNHDPRELVDIPEVRHLLKRLAAQWPYWGFFLNPVNPNPCASANGLCLLVLIMSPRQEHFALSPGLCRVGDRCMDVAQFINFFHAHAQHVLCGQFHQGGVDGLGFLSVVGVAEPVGQPEALDVDVPKNQVVRRDAAGITAEKAIKNQAALWAQAGGQCLRGFAANRVQAKYDGFALGDLAHALLE